MATVYVSMSQAGARSKFGDVEILAGPFRSETITSSGTSASGALVARNLDVATIWCATAIYANIGAAASATAGVYIPAGMAYNLAVPAGAVVHVIDAA
jgi:hypothetical protein